MGPGETVTVPADASTPTAADAVVPGRHATGVLAQEKSVKHGGTDVDGAKSATHPPVTTDWKA